MIELDDDRTRLDMERVYGWLANSYWSPSLPPDAFERAIAGSHVLGAYDEGIQVGFARAITDYASFAWIADVWIAEASRGQGLGRRMVQWFIDMPRLAGIRRIMLNTRDAHGVYAALGFHAPVRPDFLMERLGPGAAERLGAL